MINSPPSDALSTTADQRVEDAAYYRRVLHDMIDVGVVLVRQLPQQARPAEDILAVESDGDVGEGDRSLAYDRITRAVRRSILLAQSIAERPAERDARVAGRVDRRRRILRAVEDMIHRDTSGERAEGLHAELLERLDSPEMEVSLDDDRPVEEIIIELRRDMGLGSLEGRPWKRRAPEDVAELHARAAKAAVLAEAPPAMRDALEAMFGLAEGHASAMHADRVKPDG